MSTTCIHIIHKSWLFETVFSSIQTHKNSKAETVMKNCVWTAKGLYDASCKVGPSSQSCRARGWWVMNVTLKVLSSLLSCWFCLRAGARRRAVAGNDNRVRGFLWGPPLAADLPRLCITDVQVWLIFRRSCRCPWGAVAAGAHLDGTDRCEWKWKGERCRSNLMMIVLKKNVNHKANLF